MESSRFETPGWSGLIFSRRLVLSADFWNDGCQGEARLHQRNWPPQGKNFHSDFFNFFVLRKKRIFRLASHLPFMANKASVARITIFIDHVFFCKQNAYVMQEFCLKAFIEFCHSQGSYKDLCRKKAPRTPLAEKHLSSALRVFWFVCHV